MIRNDNGPDYISKFFAKWVADNGIRLDYIQPGNPQQYAYIARYNRTVHYNWLEQYLWTEVTEVQDYATKWLWHYNHERPNMALGGFPPKKIHPMGCINNLFKSPLKKGMITMYDRVYDVENVYCIP